MDELEILNDLEVVDEPEAVDDFLARTIVYLIPQNNESVALLYRRENFRYRCDNPVYAPLEGEDLPENGVLRLGFEFLVQNHARLNFGEGPEADVEIPYHDVGQRDPRPRLYFSIGYDFSNGALTIDPFEALWAGDVFLKKHQKHILEAGSVIAFGRTMELMVAFPSPISPDSICKEEHEDNYGVCARYHGHPLAPYLRPGPTVGGRLKVYGELGRGAFGVVNQVLHIDSGKIMAAKVICKRRPKWMCMKEVDIMSRLKHVRHPRISSALRTLTP